MANQLIANYLIIPIDNEDSPSSLDMCGLYQYLLISRTNLGVWLPSPIPSENTQINIIRQYLVWYLTILLVIHSGFI